jgi:hypothetical protein
LHGLLSVLGPLRAVQSPQVLAFNRQYFLKPTKVPLFPGEARLSEGVHQLERDFAAAHQDSTLNAAGDERFTDRLGDVGILEGRASKAPKSITS